VRTSIRIVLIVSVVLGASGCRLLRAHAGPIAYVGDSSINAHIEIAFVQDPRIRASEIDVRTYQGTVTLDGVVETVAARRAAQSIAQSTPGVRSVVNHLKLADAAQVTAQSHR
jgi:hyperosmotically inducible periplasmic protein